MSSRDRFGVTVDILGKRDTFMLSLDGRELTQAFAGYTEQDLRNLENTESRNFTMSFRIPDKSAVAASSLKSAYLAVFSLLGRPGGYSYVQGDALTPIRQRFLEPPNGGDLGQYVIKAPDDGSLKDIILASEPLSCWIVKIARHLVILPLSGDSQTSQPLRELRRLCEGQLLEVTGLASWSFATFGTFGTVPVHLAGADTAESLVGLGISATLSNGRPLEGTCINHSGESATLLCPVSEISSAGIDMAWPTEVVSPPRVPITRDGMDTPSSASMQIVARLGRRTRCARFDGRCR